MMGDAVCDSNFPCTALHDKSWLVAIVGERSFCTFHEPNPDTRASWVVSRAVDAQPVSFL